MPLTSHLNSLIQLTSLFIHVHQTQFMEVSENLKEVASQSYPYSRLKLVMCFQRHYTICRGRGKAAACIGCSSGRPGGQPDRNLKPKGSPRGNPRETRREEEPRGKPKGLIKTGGRPECRTSESGSRALGRGSSSRRDLEGWTRKSAHARGARM